MRTTVTLDKIQIAAPTTPTTYAVRWDSVCPPWLIDVIEARLRALGYDACASHTEPGVFVVRGRGPRPASGELVAGISRHLGLGAELRAVRWQEGEYVYDRWAPSGRRRWTPID